MPLVPADLNMLVYDLEQRFMNKKDGSAGICLFVGAGISISAGIRSASGYVEKIKERFPAHYKHAKDTLRQDMPSYAQAMESIPRASQIEIIREDIRSAKVNWAHLGIARLEQAGVFDTIMTTNFDPLLSRACNLMARYPAVYDLVAIRKFAPSLISGSAIYHLHGQHDGFALLSTRKALQDHAKTIRPVLDAKMRGKLIIICGYSGANDPLIDEIVKIDPSQHGLYWICHDRKRPAPDVCDKLLALDNCYVIQNQPSDRIFVTLANRLNIPPPKFLSNPFEHMREVLTGITPLADVVQTADRNIHIQALSMIEEAEAAEKRRRPHYEEISRLVSSGKFEEVLELFQPKLDNLHRSERAMVVWAAVAMGNRLFNQAKIADRGEATALFEEADQYYAIAMDLDQDMFEAAFNRAVVLQYRARREAVDQLALLKRASGFYESAAEARPAEYRILMDWGLCLSLLGKAEELPQASITLAFARQKFKLAEGLGAPKDLVSNKLGNCDWYEAQLYEGDKRDALRKAAEAHYLEGESQVAGSGAYNLACVFAQRRDLPSVEKWLGVAAQKNVESIGRWIDEDPDFDLIRNEPTFKALRRRL